MSHKRIRAESLDDDDVADDDVDGDDMRQDFRTEFMFCYRFCDMVQG